MYQEISNWIESILAQDIPDQVRAFCFNLYEDGGNKWSMELIGAEKFDLEDEDWPCYEVTDFGTRDNPLVWIKKASWETVLEDSVSALREYLDRGQLAHVLKGKDGLGIGFVDGDIEILFHK